MAHTDNKPIIDKMKSLNIHQYEVSDEIGVSESTFIRWLRKPLKADTGRLVSDAIARIENRRVE